MSMHTAREGSWLAIMLKNKKKLCPYLRESMNCTGLSVKMIILENCCSNESILTIGDVTDERSYKSN